MVFVCHRYILAAAALTLFCGITPGVNAEAVIKATITTAPITTTQIPTPTVDSAPGTCEFRTINYITDSLPQQCLRSAWSNTNIGSPTAGTEGTEVAPITGVPAQSTVTTASGISDHDLTQSTAASGALQQESSTSHEPASSSASPPSSIEASEPPLADPYGGELNEASFLSFEEWKKQTLEKAGQANANIGNKRSPRPGEKKMESEGGLDSLGDEGEIYLDFGAFSSGRKGGDSTQASPIGEQENQQTSQNQAGAKKQKDMYRSKDAGKTYKERFSYASFDAGATILKTHPGAKNAKAVLLENKDSYMLSECAVENKFLIIELSVCHCSYGQH
jgi:hypothetical protein